MAKQCAECGASPTRYTAGKRGSFVAPQRHLCRACAPPVTHLSRHDLVRMFTNPGPTSRLDDEADALGFALHALRAANMETTKP